MNRKIYYHVYIGIVIGNKIEPGCGVGNPKAKGSLMPAALCREMHQTSWGFLVSYTAAWRGLNGYYSIKKEYFSVQFLKWVWYVETRPLLKVVYIWVPWQCTRATNEARKNFVPAELHCVAKKQCLHITMVTCYIFRPIKGESATMPFKK